MEIGAIGNDGVMIPYITNNHEVWATCPQCGYEYDRRIWDSCPRCAGRKLKNTSNNAKNGLDRNN